MVELLSDSGLQRFMIKWNAKTLPFEKTFGGTKLQ